jgi:hypothetical protein
MFQGKMYSCIATTITGEDIYDDYALYYNPRTALGGAPLVKGVMVETLDRVDCICEFCEWKNLYLNFDNVAQVRGV